MQNVTFGANQHSTSPKEHHPYCEAWWWWQHHVMGMLLLSRDCRDRRENGWSEIQKNPRGKSAALCKKAEIGTEVHLSAWQRPEAHSQSYTGVAKEHKDKCPWVSQSEPRPKSNRKSVAWLWRLLSHQCSPRNLTELEQFCAEEWVNIANQGVQSWQRPIPTDSQL